ncbi:MAG: hypothetical protein U5K54_15570 [Cytophagales bacterium]|nr:hypothetical protein [Cytophagales bacterium]
MMIVLKIVTTIREKPGVRIRFAYEIFNGEGTLIHQGETILAFVDKNNRTSLSGHEVFQEVLKSFFA